MTTIIVIRGAFLFFKTMSFRVVFSIALLLLGLCATANAAVVGFVAVSDDQVYYEYNYEDLMDSLALKMLGEPDGLYDCFSDKMIFAILDDKQGYIDYDAVLDHYAELAIAGNDFKLNVYTESSKAKKASMPSSIKVVEVLGGSLKYSERVLGVTSTGANPEYVPRKTRVLILGEPTVSLEKAKAWASSKQAVNKYVDIADLYWEYGQKTGIRPEILYAQAAVETNYGQYTGVLNSSLNNWAGIKKKDATGDALEDHETFETPEQGVAAHFNHMSAYVGLEPLGETHDRYSTVTSQPWAGSVLYVEDLSGKWTPDKYYHTFILPLIDEMENYKEEDSSGQDGVDVGIDVEPEKENGQESIEGRVIVNVEILHLRQGPGTTYNILERLKFGALLTVYGNQNEWLAVLTEKGQEGWVHSDYVRELTEGNVDLQGIKIVIDPGHGGSDPGARGYSGYLEKTFNLSVGRKLAFLLREAGAEVVMTRSGDQTVSNVHRVEVANSAQGDLFISIHANAFFNIESNGIETLYHNGGDNSVDSLFLANQLQSNLVKAIGLRNRGVKNGSYYVLTRVNMPSALVEIGFLTNPAEEELLKQEETQDKVAEALFEGIKEYCRYKQ